MLAAGSNLECILRQLADVTVGISMHMQPEDAVAFASALSCVGPCMQQCNSA